MADEKKRGRRAGTSEPILFKRVMAGKEIEDLDTRLAQEIGYYPRALCQLALPVSDIAAAEYYRHSGPFHLSIQTPMKLGGVPYGIYPRGILAWITSEIVKRKNQTDSRVLELGSSLGEFITTISGARTFTGGATGNIPRFKRQLNCLLASRMFYWYGEKEMPFKSVEIASEGNLLWNPRSPEEEALFQSTITLGEAFFNDIRKSAVPVDLRALRALWPSCLASDLYVWLTYRADSLQREHRSRLSLDWKVIKMQFGQNFKSGTSFRQHYLKSLKEVERVYPDMEFQQTEKGIDFILKRPAVRSVSVAIRSRLPQASDSNA